MIVVIIVLAVMFVVSTAIFIGEARHAPLIDDKAPFLWDDFDPKKKEVSEEEYHYMETFCQHCKFYDGTAMCLYGDNLGELGKHVVEYCKKKSFFEAV